MPSSLRIFLLVLVPAVAFGQSVQVDITPGHVTNSFSPLRAMGGAVDGVPTGTVDLVYTPSTIQKMLSSGFGPLTYRLYTELSVQDWHWNPEGSFSAPGNQGYWTGNKSGSGQIKHSHGFNLPRSGFTTDQGTNSGYSRVDDGDPTTFWKSNPYLTSTYTKTPDSSHPQWIVFDLNAAESVNAIQLNWSQPYATDYQVQYWIGDDAIYDQGNGNWVTFPSGSVSGSKGGSYVQTLSAQPIPVRYVRVWMTASSQTCLVNPPVDSRDCLGYALNEAGVGNVDGTGTFTDLVNHQPNQNQTLTYCSSVDPWHSASDIESGEEQPGMDLIFTSGITNGIPPIIPVTMLYGTPDDSANQMAYLESKGYKVGYVELGEEPDGQYILPEDYAALYLQWADAIHAVDPNLKLGGPILQSDAEVYVWPDASGNTSWLNRFLNYLQAQNRIGDLAFMSYEHYPYTPCAVLWNDLLREPSYTQGSLKQWAADGLPANIPVFVTESNVTYDYQEQQVDLFGALWFSDFTGAFLTAGGKQVYFYEYEPLPLFPSSSCNSWGNFGMFEATASSAIVGFTSQYFSARMLTREWVDPLNATHYVFPAASDITASNGAAIVTAYALLRPDGQWSLLLINKDKQQQHAVTVTFNDAAANGNRYFEGTVTGVTFGPQQYDWHPFNANGFAQPDGPVETSTLPGGAGVTYDLPAASITVLRGVIR